MQREIGALMRKVYGTTLCRAALRDSAEIDNASARLMTVYELDQPATSRETHNRALSHLNAVSLEIETEIRKTWPSQQQRLTDEAMI
jgi:chromosome partitioning protein